MAQPIVSLNGVCKTFGSLRAVDEVSFDVYPGEIFGLLGPNGAGKTTTIRMMLDIFRPDCGEVSLFGGPMTEAKKHRIGYMPEERGLYRDQKLEPTLLYLATLKGLSETEATRRLEKWLKRLDLWDARQKKIQDLSRGMQQKAQLIATLVHEPDLIVVDEPFANLDPVNTRMAIDILEEQAQAGKAIIMSTHLMYQVEAMCNRIVLIDKGRVVLYGAVDQIKREFSTNAVLVHGKADFAAPARRARGAAGEQPLAAVPGAGATPQGVFRALAEQDGAHIERFELAEPSLDDIFINVVSGDAAERWKPGADGARRCPSSRAPRRLHGRRPMGNLWKVAVAEYNRLVHKRSFLLSLIGMPLFIGVIVAIAIFTAMPKGDDRPVGYVDLAGVTRAAVTQAYAAGEAEVDLRPFAERRGGPGGPAVRRDPGLLPDPRRLPHVAARYASHLGHVALWRSARRPFETFLTAHLVAQTPLPSAQKVLLDGVALNYRSANDPREMPQEGLHRLHDPAVRHRLLLHHGRHELGRLPAPGRDHGEGEPHGRGHDDLGLAAPADRRQGARPHRRGAHPDRGLVGRAGPGRSSGAARRSPGCATSSFPGTTMALAALFFLPTYVLLGGHDDHGRQHGDGAAARASRSRASSTCSSRCRSSSSS